MVNDAFQASGGTAFPSRKLNPTQQKNFLDKVIKKVNQASGSFQGSSSGGYGQRQTILKRVRDVTNAPGMKGAPKSARPGRARVDVSDAESNVPSISIPVNQNKNASISLNSAKPLAPGASLSSPGATPRGPRLPMDVAGR